MNKSMYRLYRRFTAFRCLQAVRDAVLPACAGATRKRPRWVMPAPEAERLRKTLRKMRKEGENVVED
jgi:hypothetical protein